MLFIQPTYRATLSSISFVSMHRVEFRDKYQEGGVAFTKAPSYDTPNLTYDVFAYSAKYLPYIDIQNGFICAKWEFDHEPSENVAIIADQKHVRALANIADFTYVKRWLHVSIVHRDVVPLIELAIDKVTHLPILRT